MWEPLAGTVEDRWRARFGGPAVTAMRDALLALAAQRWRASQPYLRQTTAVLDDPGAALPHYPMVLHRGGWPDGS